MAKIPKPSGKIQVGISTPEELKKLIDAGAPAEIDLWSPQPGPQTDVMLCMEDEIFFGGAKGGGKSYAIIGWLMRGNPQVPLDKCTPLDLTYLNCPSYRALVVRKNLEDLNSWIGEANRVYSKLGAAYTQKPNEFTFPSGAKIIMGHLDDDRAVEKYFGNVVHRAAVDELTFIESLNNYTKLLSCVRSNVKGLKAQLLLTGNPGGPGSAWVLDRFVEPKDGRGNIIPPRTTIRTVSWNPFTKRDEETTRIFIPASLKDNLRLLEVDPLYYNRLADLPETQRKAYLDGDWHAMGGTFFEDFRAQHRADEPPEACHVIPRYSRPLMPWLPRFAGCDWGFGHAAVVFGAVRDLNGQTIIHKELVVAKTSSVEVGVAIGRLFLDDLEGLYKAGVLPKINLWLSPDAFAKQDMVKTQSEGIAEGIGRVVGSKAVHLPEYFTHMHLEEHPGVSNLFREAKFQSEAGIFIGHAQNARVAGFAHLRELLRWRPLANAATDSFDSRIAYELLHTDIAKYRTYVEAYERRKPEPLPKLLIEDHCVNLIQSFPSVVSDKKNIEDVQKTDALSDDVIDAVRYLLFSPDVLENREPQRSYVQRQLQKVKDANPNIDYNSLVWAARQAEAEYGATQTSAPFSVPNDSSRHRRKPN